MKRLLPALAIAFLCACSGNTDPNALPVAQSTTVDTSSFDKVFQVTESHVVDELHSMVVLKDGEVIYQRYDTGHTPDELHVLWSASKTFTATAIGFAVQDGLLTVDDKVVSFFEPEIFHKEPSDSLKSMTIKHLLTMSSGFNGDYISDTRALILQNPTEKTLNTPLHFMPGERFQYNSMNTYLLSAIITKVTGRKLEDYLSEKLFTPLGIKNHIWQESAEGVNSGGWGLYLQSESLAKMGQFMLDKGMWKGKQLLNSEWFDEAMSVQITKGQSGSHDWTAGYGYQMWKCELPAYRIDGAWGQFVIVIPEKNAVVAITAHANNTQGILDAVWEHVYPAL